MLQKYDKKLAIFVILCYNDVRFKRKGLNIQKKVMKMTIGMIVYILVLVVFGLVGFAVMQIRLAGMKVKDFWTFIKANQILDELYLLAKKNGKLNAQQELIFLMEAEEVFKAFDKVPNMLWEEEYSKYREVLDKYKDIKLLRWANENA